MTSLEKYLLILQKENIYDNPIQTRPKPKPGISKEKIKKTEPGVEGPSGMEVDLDKDEISGYAIFDKIFDKDDEDEDDK